MDPRPESAERLPALYRAVLDAVGELERRGERRPAARIRRSATRAYGVWDLRAEQRMGRLLLEARALLNGDGPNQSRLRWARVRWSRAGRRGAGSSRGDGLAEGAPST